jgi:hypothetical protein
MAGAEATGEDGEGGASLVPTMMMTTAMQGEGKDEDTEADAVAMTTMMTTATTNKDAPLPARGWRMMMSSLSLLMPRTLTRVRLGWQQQKLQGRTGRVGHQSCQQHQQWTHP